jgi:hypothetical protein
MSNVKFWSVANFFSAHAFAGMLEGLMIGIFAGLAFPFGVAITQVVFAGGQTVFN